jgi:cytochrome c553
MPAPLAPSLGALVVLAAAWAATATAAHPGAAIYAEHCARCHGANGQGTPEVPAALAGERSLNQLAAYVDETMPEDDPAQVTGAAARQVAEWMHGAFYSAVARDRDRPARVELQRLTVRQHRSVLADVVGSFRKAPPAPTEARGLEGEYFKTRGFDRGKGFVFARTDPRIDFDFGADGPQPGLIEPERFAIRWTGSILPAETGRHEFVVVTDHSVQLWIDADEGQPATIDAYVRSGDETEHRGSVFLLGGRAVPLRLEFSKGNQGVDEPKKERWTPATIRLLWRPPHGVLEPVPARVLLPAVVPPVFAAATPFPPDDRSLGYDRGATASPEWFAAATAAAIETTDHVLERLARLSGVKPDAPDRAGRLRGFAATFVERCFRRPLTPDLHALFVDRPFADAPDPETAVRRSLLAALTAPRFLYREPAESEAFSTAARLSFGLWDSIPDRKLLEAAAAGRLATPAAVRSQAERMVADRRTRAKVRDFLLSWLRIDLGPDIVKDRASHPGFTPAVAADLRTSLEIMLDDLVWRDGDFRRLFTAEDVPLNGRLAPLYGANLPVDAPFTPVRLDDGRRGGVLTHPYLLAVLAYPGTSSPIHRGVFLARSIFGNVLRPPQEAFAPLAAEQAPHLTTRERVATQTSGVACQSCHTLINPLGFALEEFDAVGRHRSTEQVGDVAKPVNADGSYQPRVGPAASFRGGRELGGYCAGSHDAQEAFVQALFHAVVTQPVRAWGPDTLERLRSGFEAGGFDIRRLLADIMVVAAFPPAAPMPAQAASESPR